ncbi:class I adenylate-forming enzyme family protein [Streptomyces tibetensis]|uniref:class I adenylate-forming enzyme family protein n=1 Tax=Streptomyces tibetensis TaxID=2382123 RepID=UPI0033EB16B6
MTEQKPAPRRHYVAELLTLLDDGPEQRPVLVWRQTVWTAAAFSSRIRTLSAALRAAGTAEGTVLGLLTLPNHPDSLALRYAAHLLGASVVHLRTANPGSNAATLTAADQAEMAGMCGVRLIVHDPLLTDRAAELAAATGLRALGTDVPAVEADVPHRVPTMGILTFTGGTTGRPKGVRHSFSGHNDLVLSDAAELATDPGGPPRMLVTTPVSHAIAAMADAVLVSGGFLVLHEDFEPAAMLHALAAHRITRAYLAVPQLYRLLDHPDLPGTDLGALRRLIYSGSHAAPARVARAFAVLGPVLVQCYGSTETGRVTVLDQLDHYEDELRGAVGRPFPGVEVRLSEPDGEVLVRSPQCLTEYLGDPALTVATVRPDGWTRTGDLGYFDEYGLLRLTGRRHHMIKTRGARVHPAAVERELLADGAFAEAAVYSAEGPDGAELVHAAVVPGPGAPREAAEAEVDRTLARIAAHLGPEHAPTTVVLWRRLPLTAVGKPDRRRLAVPDGHPDVCAVLTRQP